MKKIILRFMALVAVAGALMSMSPRSAAAFPRDYAIYYVGVRNAGMGEAGTADYRDLANIAFNPALVAMMDGVQAMYSRADVSFISVDMELDGYIVGGGKAWDLNEQFSLGGGAYIGYAKEQWGLKDFYNPEDDSVRWGTYQQAWTFGVGAVIGYRNRVRLGVGIDHKRHRWDNGGETEHDTQITEANVFDAGFDLEGVLLSRDSFRLTAAAGFAYLNFGGEIESIEQPIFLPAGDGGGTVPQFRRYGLNIGFETRSMGAMDDIFEAALPIMSVAFNYDVIDELQRSYPHTAREMLGVELGFLGILYYRMGRMQVEESIYMPGGSGESVSDITNGLGLNIPYHRYRLRIDYARRDFEEQSTEQTRVGVLFEVKL